MGQNLSKKLLLIVLLFFVSASFIIGLYLGSLAERGNIVPLGINDLVERLSPSNKEINFTLFQKIWETIKEKYVLQPVDQEKMFYGALTGLVASLDDPYSTFLDPQLTRAFKNEIGGSFEGIGAEIGIKNDQLTIIAPLPDSPAEKAGLKAGDIILEIDSRETGDLSLDYATSLIRGKKGTEVKLTISRNGDSPSEVVTIRRDKIKIVSVTWDLRPSEDGQKTVGYLQISSFTEDTEDGLEKAINYFNLHDAKGIILDLRNNSGGYLDQAIIVASVFIEEGPILYEEFSDGSKKSYPALGQAYFEDYPVVVLINEGSASSSEIVAGALKDYKKATLVGKTSFGKGSVQEYEELSDGSSFKLTTANWQTPGGYSIDQTGITPDIEVDLTEEDYNNNRDPQLEKATEVISSKL